MKHILLWTLSLLAIAIMAASCINIGKHMGATLTPYTCDSGQKLDAKYPTRQIVYLYIGRGHHVLRLAPESKSRHYRNDKFDWRTVGTGPGSEGILSKIGKNEDDLTVVERCTEDD